MMLTTVLEKVLAVLFAAALAGGFGALWYADHQRAAAELAKQAAKRAVDQTQQAENFARSAAQAASDAQAQLRAASDATAAAQKTADAARADAAKARANLARVASSPEAAKVLTTDVPASVWSAIYNKGE